MAVVQFIVSAATIIACGAALTRFADAIAQRTQLGRLWVGSIFLATATSLPELSVDVSAVRQELPDVAVGDLLGSCLFNLLILGILDLSHHSRGRLLSRVSAAHALSGVMSIVLMTFVGMSIAVGSLGSAGRISLGSVAIIAAYLLGIRLVYYDQRFAAGQTDGKPKRIVSPPTSQLTLRQAVVGYVLTAAVILIAGPFLAEAAGAIAGETGLGETFVGTTFVALSTSLPELVTAFTALRIGALDLALGNIFGSNSFNMVLIFVVDLAYRKPLLAEVAPTHLVTCLSTILITSVAVLGQLYQVETRKRFLEPDALLVIGLVLTALAVIYVLRGVAL